MQSNCACAIASAANRWCKRITASSPLCSRRSNSPALETTRGPVLFLVVSPAVQYHHANLRRSWPVMPKPIFILIVAAVLSMAQTVAAQSKPAVDPQDKQRNIKQEPDKAFTDWLKDVGPIISKDEHDAWPKLRTNEE